MRSVVQRVSSASLAVAGLPTREIAAGLVALVGFAPSDTDADLRWMSGKITGLRIFADDEGKLNRSVTDIGGSVLVVPNFTLHGDCRKGKRPSFTGAAPPEQALELFEAFCTLIGAEVPVQTGVFGAHMHVTLTNDGPITLILDSERPQPSVHSERDAG